MEISSIDTTLWDPNTRKSLSTFRHEIIEDILIDNEMDKERILT